MALEAIRYKNGNLEVLDQLLLPDETKYIQVKGTKDGWNVIKKMQVSKVPWRCHGPPLSDVNITAEFVQKKLTQAKTKQFE